MGIFSNPKSTGSKISNSPKYGANQRYFEGRGTSDGVGHGHENPNNGFVRPSVSDFLGNAAARGAGVELTDKSHTPKW